MILMEISKPRWLGNKSAPCHLVCTNDQVLTALPTYQEACVAARDIWCSFVSSGEAYPCMDDKAIYMVQT